MTTSLILIGASVRAAAQSALRAGLTPWCADLFGDYDLRQLVPDVRVCPKDEYPQGFLPLLADAPKVPLAYTGGLENYSLVVGMLTRDRPLWGTSPHALMRVRDPIMITHVLRDAGFHPPGLALDHSTMNPAARYLVKPIKSSGGQGITFADATTEFKSSIYVQEYLQGDSLSAVCVALPKEVRVLGFTKQLIGTDWLGTTGFTYAGNIGPWDVARETIWQTQQIATVLHQQFGLRGLFGIDFILMRGHVCVVEVNPRYPASVEVLERAGNLNAFAWHRRAFDVQAPKPSSTTTYKGVVGKGILYGQQSFTVTPEQFDYLRSQPDLADIPHAGTIIEPQSPICTVFANAKTAAACETALRTRAAELRMKLG